MKQLLQGDQLTLTLTEPDHIKRDVDFNIWYNPFKKTWHWEGLEEFNHIEPLDPFPTEKDAVAAAKKALAKAVHTN